MVLEKINVANLLLFWTNKKRRDLKVDMFIICVFMATLEKQKGERIVAISFLDSKAKKGSQFMY